MKPEHLCVLLYTNYIALCQAAELCYWCIEADAARVAAAEARQAWIL
jgi:hypothetical protein